MDLYSTNNKNNIVSFRHAVLKSFPEDKGLYIPCILDKLPSSFINELNTLTFKEISFEVCKHIIKDTIPFSDLTEIIERAISFPAPIVSIDNNISILELFHGPTMAFKDFGAIFMGEVMSYFLKDENQKTTILVATSGDTGGAVASGFHKKEGIDVVILYPKNQVSPIQEMQLTTWGDNITAIEIDGNFDDCQRLVKTAFLDIELSASFKFSSANSINIARLIPQTFYYFEGYKQISFISDKINFVVPSGNLGNLTAGVIAKKIGLPIYKFIAATNLNKTVPEYIKTGKYSPMKSITTLSNAMDVGDPSNFPRLLDLYGSTWNMMKNDIQGFSFNDIETLDTIKTVFNKFNYLLDPHTAVAYLGAKKYLTNDNGHCVLLETAHPSKFLETIKRAISNDIELPEKLKTFKDKKKQAYRITNKYKDFKQKLFDIS